MTGPLSAVDLARIRAAAAAELEGADVRLLLGELDRLRAEHAFVVAERDRLSLDLQRLEGVQRRRASR